jgi:hypothetical protein
MRRVAPVARSVANRSSFIHEPADHATTLPSGDHARWCALSGTAVTARGPPPTGMIQSLPSASMPTVRASGESASPMNARTCCGRPGSGNGSGGSERRARWSDRSAVKRISAGVPPLAGTLQRRPSALYTRAMPSAVHCARVGVTSVWLVRRVIPVVESSDSTQSWIRSVESRPKNASRPPSGENAGARASMVSPVSGLVVFFSRSASQMRVR